MMLRALWVVAAGLGLALFMPLQAQDKEPAKAAPDKALAGNWKVVLALPPGPGQPPQPVALWLMKFNKKDAALEAEVLATSDALSGEDPAAAKISDVVIKDGVLTFTIKMPQLKLDLELKVPGDDGGKMLGSATLGQRLIAAKLERTELTGLDSVELAKEAIAQKTDAIELVPAVGQLINRAEKIKAKPEEVRAWMDKALKSAEAYGSRYHRSTLLDLSEVLVQQDGFGKVVLPYARRAERALTAKDKPAMQERTLKLLASALEAAGEKDEAKKIEERIAKIDQSVRTEPVARTGKSDRVAVVELFTGTECPPCVAADMAFDGLGKTFKPSDVILLQYHQHIPGPDPLTNKDGEARMKYYRAAFARQVGGTPSILFNGEPAAPGGGRKADAQDKYDQYLGVIRPLLEKESRAKLKATATQKGDSIEIKAEVADLKDTGDSVRLRFLLVEQQVDYKGGNGIAEHHYVVRAMPGGVEGVALKDKTFKHGATIDLATLRKDTKKYLEDFYKENGEELPKEVPMDLKTLKVVALVQDDNTREILQAIQVPVEAAK